ncbi:glycosyltransferase [Candidatus Collierbacteria bacterium]|nr:glycosyltransferase [Candidatus Collierbacteria bacterium]
MKILMLTPYLPWPLNSGGQIRTYNLLKNLAHKHEISLFSFIRDDEERKYIGKLKPYCRKILLFKRTQSPWAIRNILLAGLTPYPFLVCIYLSKTAKDALRRELNREKYDIIHAETFYVMPNIPATEIPTLLVEQTIEYLGYQTYTAQTAMPLLRPLLHIDVIKLKFWEKLFWKKADHLVTMSTEDRDWIKRMVPDSKVSIVANGIDVEYFKNTPIRRPKSPTVLFVGNYKWLPNVDAAKYIAYEIWPSIHRQIPNAELKIVGRDATNEILKLKRIPGVNVIGEVGDIREALGSAHVMLAPIRNGRGTRYKILEAMAAGLPVVSTSLGIEGIRAKDGVNALIRDSKEELVRATVELLKNPALTKKLAINGKRLVDNNFNWEKISGDLDVVYQKLGRLHEN